MGLFDFLFGGKKRSNAEVVPDRIWMTTAAKFAGLTKEASDRSESGTVAVLLVAHFPDVLKRLEKIANQQAWDVPCMAVPASNLNTKLTASLRVDESATIDIIVVPLPPKRDAFASTQFLGEPDANALRLIR